MSPNPRKRPILKNLQELGLNGEIKASNFVEEQRSHVCLFHPALFGRHGTGKGAFFVSEQLGFKQ
ncbi:hypothetical protein GCM10011585_10220 [Edaphobacter dinghuensis]|uniref:Uncharacterized protein n=1 Tax=Edaphobacter dinghuensis TaxID=1560005 RepID=A0A917LZX1_9BACT|nr:hypothetical protein GCM10011585_10220 [Edaphobacter dinghuensis]